jgi:hypothetical protein
MGYTHYYYVSSYYKQEVWDALLKDVKKLLVLPIPKVCAVSNTPPYEYEYMDIDNLGELINTEEVIDGNQGYYNIDETEISFNGIGELAHEQFKLYQRMPPDVFERQEEFAKRWSVPPGIEVQKEQNSKMLHPYFECTKTARKPYDIVVQCCLILAKKHLGDGIAVSSDGGEDEWTEAIRIIEKNFGYKVKTRWSRDEGEIFSKVK